MIQGNLLHTHNVTRKCVENFQGRLKSKTSPKNGNFPKFRSIILNILTMDFFIVFICHGVMPSDCFQFCVQSRINVRQLRLMQQNILHTHNVARECVKKFLGSFEVKNFVKNMSTAEISKRHFEPSQNEFFIFFVFYTFIPPD